MKVTYSSPKDVNMSKGFGEFLNYINLVTDSWISNMLMIAVYVIVLIGYYKSQDDFAGALAVAGYGTFVVGLLFWIGGFVSSIAFGVSIAIAIIGTLVLLLDKN